MKYIIITISLLLASNAFSQNIPKNARHNEFTDEGWSCNSGYKQHANQCKKVNVPQNARINDYTPEGWSCNSGYKQYGNHCKKVSVPQNARINDYTPEGWSCNSGYKQHANQCKKVNVPQNARINDYTAEGWSCNSGYKAVGNTCIIMTEAELAKEVELKRKIAAYEKRQKALGHCETEYKTGAEVCVSILDGDLDCDESYSGNYYDSCEVELSYKVETDYSGSAYIDATVNCEVEIEYIGKNTYSTDNESESERYSHTLYAHDSSRRTFDFDFDFGLYDEVNSVKISEAECKVTDVSMY